MRSAYADRAAWLGDPDRTKVPVAGLVSKRYAAGLAAAIRPDRARLGRREGGRSASPRVRPDDRPLSSMSPTFLLRDGRLALVTGSPGGSRIITTVLQVVLGVVDFGLNIAEAVAAPRVHHQWRPDAILAETGLSPDTLRLLRERGHKVVVGSSSGSANSILVGPDGLTGASDGRQRGTLADGY